MPQTDSHPYIIPPNSLSSVKENRTSENSSSDSHKSLKVTTVFHSTSSRPGLGIDTERTLQPRRSKVRKSPGASSRVIERRSCENPLTVALKVSGHLSPEVLTSTAIEGFGFELHHLPTVPQNLSWDEFMLVSHQYRSGLVQARYLSAQEHRCDGARSTSAIGHSA